MPIISHPPSSPDLNPIEACWNMVKGRLRKRRRHATSIDELWRDIQREWDAITIEEINTNIKAMSERRKAVLQVKGGHMSF